MSWLQLPAYKIDHGGRCTCVWDVLNSTLPESLIDIIDEYLHRSDDIHSAIISELADNREEIIALGMKMPEWKKVWIFDGNLAGDSYVCMDYSVNPRHMRGPMMIKDPTSRIVIKSDEKSLDITVDTCKISIRDILITNGRDDFSWGYRWTTPFSRKRRHWIRPFVDMDLTQDAVSGCMNTFDVVCDVAHDAIWRWFHCDPDFKLCAVSHRAIKN